MTASRCIRLLPSSTRIGWLAALLVCGLVRLAWAADPLGVIPADAPLVLGFRDLGASAGRLEAFFHEHNIPAQRLDLDEVQRGFNLADGVVDTSHPVFLVLTRPALEASAFVLVFKPKTVSDFSQELSGVEGGMKQCTGPEGRYWLAMRDDLALVGLSPRALRPVRRLPVERSLASELDDRQKAIFASSDVFIHIPLAKWQERIQPFIFLASNMIKLGAQADSPATVRENTAAVLDWFAGGLQTLVSQMDSLTLAVGFDGETFRLTHHHAFARGGSVAGYLSRVKRRGLDFWSTLPDRPFFIIGAFDWQCPGELALTSRFNKFVFFRGDHPATGVKLSDDTRQRLQKAMDASQEQMWGSLFMVTSPAEKLAPLQLYGGYCLQDARQGVDDLVFLQENATEAMSAFLGEQVFGQFKPRPWEAGGTLFELRLDAEHMDQQTRRQIISFYGEGACIQEAAIDEHHVVYAAAVPPAGIDDFLEVRRVGRGLNADPAVRAMLGRLPDDSNAMLIVDVGRCVAALPTWVDAKADGGTALASAPEDSGSAAEAVVSGRLLGWAGTVHPDSFTGQLVIGADDAVEVFNLCRKMAERLAQDAGGPEQSRAGRPWLR